jgi:superfamily I DNA and/or RNA helicase
MRPEISRLVIQYFYAEELQDNHSVEIDRSVYTKYIELCGRLNQNIPIWAASEWPIYNVIMINMKEGARTSSKNDNKNSKFNNGHVLIVRDLLNLLLQENTSIRPQDIVVITPYLAQRVRHIRTLKEAARYNKSLENVIVSTVDKFQGQESNIVVLDLIIRSSQHATYGFMSDRHRLNVAISCARNVLIVIGDANKYNLRYAKAKIPTQYQKFLQVMADIAKHTILWNGDQSEITSMDRWDVIDED